MNRRAIVLACVLVTLCTFRPITFPQAREHLTETKAEVPALARFHTVIYKIWHTAWPDSDYAMLSAALPEIHRHMEELTAAKLPGILRDKQTAWLEALGQLREIVAEYDSAVEAKDNPRLLDAAEKLHAQYETLVRVIRPAMKELDEFHVVLYTLYHHQMSRYDFDTIKKTAADLKKKMKTLNKATIPGRLQARADRFIKARAGLSASVETLSSTLSTRNEKKIRRAVEQVHTDYQTLEKIFE
jgi:hypothetical protein